ncbi:putative aminodeoxychorismate lyase [compost metagenome]
MKKSIIIFVTAILILIGAIGASVGYLAFSFINSRPSDVAQEVVYEVKPGVAFNTIAKELELQGLVKNGLFLSWYAKITGERSKVKVGEYLLTTAMNPKEILQVITSGKSIARSFTVSEGLSTYEIAALYETEKFGTAEEFMRWVRDPVFVRTLLGEDHVSLEGYLFPETYMLTKFTDTKTLITNMVRRFLHVYEEVAPKSQVGPWPRHKVVTLASIIEKETGAA